MNKIWYKIKYWNVIVSEYSCVIPFTKLIFKNHKNWTMGIKVNKSKNQFDVNISKLVTKDKMKK